jgi:DNA-3-methyladenine glycosylase I
VIVGDLVARANRRAELPLDVQEHAARPGQVLGDDGVQQPRRHEALDDQPAAAARAGARLVVVQRVAIAGQLGEELDVAYEHGPRPPRPLPGFDIHDCLITTRCAWVPLDDPLYVAYHDDEWGVPSHDERHLFELLTLEGAQAGLSWSTILHKRDGYRSAFAGFDVEAVARFGKRDVERLLGDARIVRNRLKVESAVNNAQRLLELREELGGLDEYIWGFVGGEPIVGWWRAVSEIPAETAESRALSKDLKKRGFRFVGPTVCYAFMQAVGLVDDHTLDCFRRAAR